MGIKGDNNRHLSQSVCVSCKESTQGIYNKNKNQNEKWVLFQNIILLVLKVCKTVNNLVRKFTVFKI